jgi:ligand-binding sensor domain-containing protein
MNRISFLVSFILIFLVQNLSGQQFYTKNYNINDGLPDNGISVIYKDSRGYIWIGTKAGLTRFDGFEFKTFTSLDGLAGNKVTSITEDQYGNLFIGCFDGGLSKFDKESFQNLNQNDGLINNNITRLKYSSGHHLVLIGTTDGLTVYDDGNGIYSFHISLNNAKQRLDITDFLEINNSIYILTRSSGLYEFLPDSRDLKKVIENNRLNYNSLFSSHITSNNDTILSLGRKGFKLINQNGELLFEKLGHVECFASDNKENIWIGSTSYGYQNNGGIYKIINNKTIDFTDKFGIESRMITTLYYDEFEQILWIGTEDNGLYLFFGDVFSYFKPTDLGVENLTIKDIKVDGNNNLWVLTTQHLIRKDNKGRINTIPLNKFKTQFEHFKENELKNKYQYLIDPSGSFEKYEKLIKEQKYTYPNPYVIFGNNKQTFLPSGSLFKPYKYDIILEKTLNNFNSILFDKDNNLWLGSNTGVFRFNQLTQEIKYIDLEDNFFTNYCFTQNNRLIATGWENAVILDNPGKNTKGIISSHYAENSPVNIIKSKQHKNKTWFLSSDHFLFLYSDTKFYLFDNPDSTNFQQLNDICFDSNDNIIAGGNEGKVFIMKLVDNQLRVKYTLSKLNGLIGTNIKWLACNKEDILFIGTNLGINTIDLTKLYSGSNVHVEIIDKSSGFINYSGFLAEIDTNGNLWIAADKELIKINTQTNQKKNNYRFHIKSIEVNNEPLDLKNINWSDKNPSEPIILPWYKNSVTFNLEIIKYTDPHNIRFFYTLNNGKTTIEKETSDRSIRFQNLIPGRYNFTLSPISAEIENQAEAFNIMFIIRKPFYKYWVVIIGLIILFSSIIWYSINWRTKIIKNQERKRLEIAEKIAELELKALRSQMNPHFIFNAINSIQNYMLGNDVDSALNYLSDFAKLIRITLDNVSKKLVTLEEELNYLKYYLSLEQMRFDKKFETVINVPNEFDYNRILIPPMIIQPFIENAIKHGFANKTEKGIIKIDFYILNHNLVSDLHCTIEDNGIGRIKSKELNKNQTNKQKSKGTIITRERLALLNQTHPRKGYKIETTDLFNEQNEACGTKVDITFPI